jgi:4-amino-4-deoxy-L-arabinose transferase-like glycosyltransferase
MYIHPPLFPYMLGALTLASGGSLGVLRLVTVVLGALTPIFVLLLGRELWGIREGVLAALLLAFSGYHILYSRVLMLEVPMLFFLTAGSYLFLRGMREERQRYAIGAGVLLGLAIITKWVALLYIPSFLLYLLVSRRSLKGLVDRKVLLTFTLSGLVALPCVAALWASGVNPLFRNFGIDTPPVLQVVGIEEIWLPDLIARGIQNFLEMSMDAGSRAWEEIPWGSGFLLIGGAVFLVTMASSIFGWVRGRRQEAFLFSIFLVFAAFIALYGKRFQYYLIWLLPTYLLLISGAMIRLVSFASNGRLLPRLVSSAALALILVLLVSIIPTGILAPLLNGGPTFGFDDQVRAMSPSLSEGDIIAASFPEVVHHYLEEFGHEPFENRILVLPLNLKVLGPLGVTEQFDLRTITYLSPRFIITLRYYSDQLAGSEEMREINRKYRLVSEIGEVLLYERAAR